MDKKPAQAQTAKAKGYKTKGLTATKWKKAAHPAEDAASRPATRNLEKTELSKTRAARGSAVPSFESKKVI